jgi:peptide deformylase
MKSEKILLLGNPLLHQKSDTILQSDLEKLKPIVEDLHDILFEFKAKFAHYGAFRGIAAPQIGVMKRLIYMYVDEPIVFINPILTNLSEEKFDVWDDCMCFPNLLVKLKRHVSCTIHFKDMDWQDQTMHFEGSLSELIQHEYDHLEGILATEKAIDSQSFRWRN